MRHPRYKWKFHIPKGKDENNLKSLSLNDIKYKKRMKHKSVKFPSLEQEWRKPQISRIFDYTTISR